METVVAATESGILTRLKSNVTYSSALGTHCQGSRMRRQAPATLTQADVCPIMRVNWTVHRGHNTHMRPALQVNTVARSNNLNLSFVRARWVVVALFFAGCAVTLAYNGPFFDEGIYIVAGIRTFEGHGMTDGYLTWFAGTLLWPMLSAIGWRVGGIVGTRAIAVLLGTASVAAAGQAAANLYGDRVGFWATLSLALNGALISLARLGVYDGLALAGIAVSFWAITELARQDHRLWLVTATLAWVAAVFAKYPIGLMVIPLLALLPILRGKRGYADAALFLFIAAALGLALYMPLRDQIGGFFDWRLQNKPGFGVPLKVIAYAIFYLSTVPTVMAIIGWVLSKERRQMATLLLLCLAIWPAYQLLAQDPVGTNKHIVFGFLLASPLVGVSLSRLWDLAPRVPWNKATALLVVVGLAWLALGQVTRVDRAWPNLSAPANYLAQEVEPGDHILASEGWPITLELYDRGRLQSPWDVYDQYRLSTEPSAPDVCDFDWVVDTAGSYAWSEGTRGQLAACPSYVQVAEHTSTVVNPGADLTYVAYPVTTRIWRNADGDR